MTGKQLALVGLAASALAVALPVRAMDPQWMSEEAMRAAFIGKTLDGHYGNGITWTETYGADGRLDYREATRRAVGRWYFHGHVFCTFYDAARAEPALNGGCWTAIKVSANCYEFYLAGLNREPPYETDPQGMAQRWNAQGWRQGEPSTCAEKPTV
jgi:hypothetical protein